MLEKVSNYEDLVKKAAMFDLVCKLCESDSTKYLVFDIVYAVKEGLDGGPSDCAES